MTKLRISPGLLTFRAYFMSGDPGPLNRGVVTMSSGVSLPSVGRYDHGVLTLCGVVWSHCLYHLWGGMVTMSLPTEGGMITVSLPTVGMYDHCVLTICGEV